MNDTTVDHLFALTRSFADISHYIYLYYCPFLFVGVAGNTLALVLLVKQGRQLSCHLIPMIFIAIGDCGTLITALIIERFITEGVGSASIIVTSRVSCKVVSYFWGITNALSVNTILIVALDRYLALIYPIWHRTITRLKVLLFCLLFTLIVALISTPLPVYWVNIPEYMACYIAPGVSASGTVGLQAFINLFYNGVLSSCILCVFDVIIARKLLNKRFGQEVTSTERKAAANLLTMAILFLLATVPRCIAFTSSFFYAYIYVNFQLSMLFLEVAKILDVLFYTYCAFSWSIYVTRFKLLRRTRQGRGKSSVGVVS